jgi:hypothetical protein
LWNTGCGDIETTEEVIPPALDSRVADGFVTENLGVGEGWYAYDSRTHSITPYDVSYVVSSDGSTTAFAVDSYYGDNGESGVMNVSYRQENNGVWSDAKSVRLGNIKEAPVCWDLREVPTVVDCGQEWTLRFAAEPRIVPAAGFAVTTPMIQTAGSLTLQSDVVMHRTDGGLSTLPDTVLNETNVVPAALTQSMGHVLSGRNESGRTFYQATPTGHLIRWTIEETDGASAELTYACAPLVMSSDEPIEFGPQGSARLSAAADAPIGIKWCTSDALREGSYWETEADLWLTAAGHLIVGRGSLIFDSTDANGEIHPTLWAAEP